MNTRRRRRSEGFGDNPFSLDETLALGRQVGDWSVRRVTRNGDVRFTRNIDLLLAHTKEEGWSRNISVFAELLNGSRVFKEVGTNDIKAESLVGNKN